MYEVTVSITREGEDRNEQIAEVIVRNEDCITAVGVATHAAMHSIPESEAPNPPEISPWPGGLH